jgi:membrane dipeptidase
VVHPDPEIVPDLARLPVHQTDGAGEVLRHAGAGMLLVLEIEELDGVGFQDQFIPQLDLVGLAVGVNQDRCTQEIPLIEVAVLPEGNLPFVEDLSGPGQFGRLIGLLERKGYTAARIEKIMGLNFVNYAREVWGA